MSAIFLQPALDDLYQATEYFESISEQLAQRFRRCVAKTIDAILTFPRASAIIRKAYRIRQVVRFRNYGILYRIRAGVIFIHAIFYLPRGPRYWRSRLR